MTAKVPHLKLPTKTQGIIMEETFPINIWVFLTCPSFWLFVYYSELITKLPHPTEVMLALYKRNYWMPLPLSKFTSQVNFVTIVQLEVYR